MGWFPAQIFSKADLQFRRLLRNQVTQVIDLNQSNQLLTDQIWLINMISTFDYIIYKVTLKTHTHRMRIKTM